MSRWTHPLCWACWREWAAAKFGDAGRQPVRLVGDLRQDERCASCGATTHSGIYVRADPATMPYASVSEDSQ